MLVIAPSDVEFASYAWTKNSNSKSMKIFQSDSLDILATVYDISGDPATPADFSDGPTSWKNRYGDRRKFFPIGQKTYVWQDKTSKGGKITTFDEIT